MEAAPTFPLQGWRSGEPSKDKGSGSGHLFLSLSLWFAGRLHKALSKFCQVLLHHLLAAAVSAWR